MIHEGKYAAEVKVELEYTDEAWSPTMSGDDARKLKAVRLALRRGGVTEPLKHVRADARRGQVAAARKPALGV
jgi:hypothetical protein